MAGTLLVLGVTLLLLGTVLLARDAVSRGRSSLMMVLPFTGADHVRSHWRELWWQVLLRIVGACLVIAGVAVTIAQDPLVIKEPQRLAGKTSAAVVEGSQVAEMNSFANSEEVILRSIRLDRNPDLSGSINGREFVYDRVQVDKGIITIQQGQGFLADLEVRVMMDINPDEINRRQEWYVQPGDDNPPEIHLSELPAGETLPVTRIIRSGYRLDLQMARLDRNQLTGFMQLILPDAQRSYLSGEFTAFTNNLRYEGDSVDLTYDHTDTLEYVATEYLDTQFPEKMLKSVSFRDSALRSSSGTGSTVARVTLSNGRIEDRLLRFERTDVGWAVSHGSREVTVIQEAGDGLRMRTVVPGDEDRSAQQETEQAEALEPLVLSFTELGTLAGRVLDITRVDGKQEQASVLDVKRGKLRLEKMVGNGMVQFSLEEGEIATLALASGQPVRLTGEAAVSGEDAAADTAAAQAPTANEAEPEPEAIAPEPSGAVLSEEILALKRYQGKQVEITGVDGKVRSGQVSAVTDTRLQLTVRVGSGQLEYYYDPKEVVDIRELDTP